MPGTDDVKGLGNSTLEALGIDIYNRLGVCVHNRVTLSMKGVETAHFPWSKYVYDATGRRGRAGRAEALDVLFRRQ